jgi:protein phosphatase
MTGGPAYSGPTGREQHPTVGLHGSANLFAGRIAYAGLTDPGRVRPLNEDGLLLLPGAGVFAVADGLGGLDGGDIASRTALQALAALYTAPGGAPCCPLFPPEDEHPAGPPLAAVVAAVNLRTFRQKIALGRNMATTLAMIQCCGPTAAVVHVGDSRVYRWRGGELRCLTRDHSLVNELCDQGAMTPSQAEQSRQRHVITRAIGAAATVAPTVNTCDLLPGDLLLLCTDGLTAMLADTEISALLKNNADRPGQTVARLVAAANEAGGRDNVTVVLVQLTGPGDDVLT